MGNELKKAVLPENYDNYVFDLYGTLVDIHTDERELVVWQKLALFYGYYGAHYEPEELRKRYADIVKEMENALKNTLEAGRQDSHESSPEIEITKVFQRLYTEKGIQPEESLAVYTGQFFRVLTTEYVRLYAGTKEMLACLKKLGKNVYLLSNAQRIFTAYEMNDLGISEYFDDILISSDFQTRKPDEQFFGILVKRHSLDCARSLFIGNDSQCDIMGARRVGMDTFYVHSNISPENDSAESANYIVNKFLKWEY